MQASWCPELPGDNKGFCLCVCETFWLHIFEHCFGDSRADLLQWSKTCSIGWNHWKPPRGDPSFRSSWNAIHHWAPCFLQTLPGPRARCNSQCPQSAHLAVAFILSLAVWPWLAEIFLIYGIFQPGLYEHSWPRGWLHAKLCCQIYKGVVNFGRKVVTS